MQGNLKDFAITSILPIIKAETKTGTLEVKNEPKTILVGFVDGSVVYAQYGDESSLRRARETLFAAGLIAPDGWRALEQQAGNPEHFWTSLANVVPPEAAQRVLRRQITDTLFDLLRQKKGTYAFHAMKKVEYPSKLVNPMDVDFLLMEGCRIADEYSQLEKRLPNPNRFLRRAIFAPGELPAAGKKGKEVAEPADFRDTVEFSILSGRGIEVNEHEMKVLSVMGKPRPLKAIMEMVDLSQFDASNAVISLLTRKIAAEMSLAEMAAATRPEEQKQYGGYAVAGILALLLAGALYVRATALHPMQMANWKALAGTVATASAKRGMGELLDGLRIHYAHTGKEARSLEEAVRAGNIRRSKLIDPWGNPYEMKVVEGGFTISSLGLDGVASADDVSLAE